MNAVLKKLLYKEYTCNLILNEAEEFKVISKDISGEIHDEISDKQYKFVLIFSKRLEVLKEDFKQLQQHIDKASVLWVVYPKGASKKYKKETDLSRDMLQPGLKDFGYEGVSLVSIDEDWSAMRFRTLE